MNCGYFYDNARIVGLFTKLEEPSLPNVVSLTPANNAVNVELNSPIRITFDKNITVNNLSGITISPSVGGISASVSGSILNITHDDLKEETIYTITVPANAIVGYNEAITWKFTTKKGVNIPVYLHNDVQVYPNPSNGVVNVSVTENSTVKVLDVLGRVLDVYTVNGNSVLNFTQAAGFYFIQVESNGKISTHKVVITKN